MSDEDEDVPLLEDIVRTGNGQPVRSADDTSLTAEEIEAIAARVLERQTREMERAMTRAIRTALEIKSRGAGPAGGGDDA